MAKATIAQIVLPIHVNGQHRLFGGQLMAWIDVTAAVAARRFAGSEVTTVAVDNLTFLGPAKLNDTVVLKAQLTWTGETSMEVRVDTYVEPLIDQRELINVAYLVFVAVDEAGVPRPVPRFVPQDEAQQAEWEAACLRKAHREQFHPHR